MTGRVPPSTKAESAAINRLCLPQLREHLNSANADVLQAFGYQSGGDPYTAYAETWRAGPLRCQGNTLDATPMAEEMNYWGHNLVRYRDRFYAVPIAAARWIWRAMKNDLAGFLNADNLAGLRTMVMDQTLTKETEDTTSKTWNKRLRSGRSASSRLKRPWRSAILVSERLSKRSKNEKEARHMGSGGKRAYRRPVRPSAR